MPKTYSGEYRRPSALPKIHEHMPLARKLALLRGRIHANGYTPYRHRDAPREKSRGYLKANTKPAHIRMHYVNTDSPNRSSFTVQEIEAMWLALCQVFEFVGGNRALLARLTGLSPSGVGQWANAGRISPFGAHLIGKCPEIPMTRIDVRPDMSAKAWREFDKSLPGLYAKRDERLYQSARRAGENDDAFD